MNYKNFSNYSADFFMPHLPALRVVDRFVLLWQAGITQIFSLRAVGGKFLCV